MMVHVGSEIDHYWGTSITRPNHPISKYLGKNRFLELHIRFRLGGDLSTTYTRVCYLFTPSFSSSFPIYITNISLDGRSHEKTNIPNKPNPIGVKVWAIAQSNYLLVWNYYTPGEKNGPPGTRVPTELGGSKKKGTGGNKT